MAPQNLLLINIGFHTGDSDLGVHIDGFISQAAHTAIVGQSEEAPLGGRAADAICAAYYAGELAHRLVKPGNTVRHQLSLPPSQEVSFCLKCAL